MIKANALTTYHLKLMMLVAMVIDHVAWAFVPTESFAGELMHIIGRMVAPMMAYFLAMGFAKSRDVMHYLGRLFGFAVMSQPVFMWFQYQIGTVDAISDVMWGNVLFTLTVSLAVLMVWRQNMASWAKWLVVIALCFVAELAEYGAAMILWACIFDRLMAHKARMLAVFALSLPVAYLLIYGVNATVGLGFMHLGWLFVIPLILLHNGTKGRRLGGRYFFYVFYPVHMAVIAAMVWIYDRWWGF
ncbi:conjugal transfer protein TraX [Moraxella sp. FZLJ2107]|uniref:TraX family protein n=1 Tax=unclassified Moraxella TaxID=2685852 RepID=UPI0020C90340|nr:MULTISPECIES: TraX family protein [unclassified Moraxella]UTO04938.1 conjugal transfer protein TraX [Moraxella sp. FZLJ2107]UTO21672.1 conjugal transfer protein TraX [Moraxella sp. FZLJ2109]